MSEPPSSSYSHDKKRWEAESGQRLLDFRESTEGKMFQIVYNIKLE